MKAQLTEDTGHACKGSRYQETLAGISTPLCTLPASFSRVNNEAKQGEEEWKVPEKVPQAAESKGRLGREGARSLQTDLGRKRGTVADQRKTVFRP